MIHSGFDNYLFTPNGRVHRLLTRLAVENLFHPFQPFIMGQMYYPPKMAANFNIPSFMEKNRNNAKKENSSSTKDARYFSTNDKNVHISGLPLAELTQKFILTKWT